jgi:[DsrC]-trisulfide reductase subunit M
MNFIFGIVLSSIAVLILVLIPLIGVWVLKLNTLFGVVVPYLAAVTFFVGIIGRVVGWARSPVPFRIPTTGGQQWSLPWLSRSRIDNPKSTAGVVMRMIFEVLTFRSLFRNTKMQFRTGPKIGYEWEKWLWLFALAFHYSFLVVLIRHLRFFTEPVPGFVTLIENVDGFIQAGIAPLPGYMLPGVMISGFVLLGAVTLLVLRRILIPQMNYLSLPSDYFPLFLITVIAITGILMRYVLKVDIINVKALTMGLATFRPTVPQGIGVLFYIHIFLVSVLIAYIPFSKITHMAGIFLSPTRNLSNNSRFVRHVNPWNYPVQVHTYEEYEEEFRDKMIEAGLPVEKTAEREAGSSEEEKE